jgi:hypothetical protein
MIITAQISISVDKNGRHVLVYRNHGGKAKIKISYA